MPLLPLHVRAILGKAVGEPVAPALYELPVIRLSEPTIGWLTEDNYCFQLPLTNLLNTFPILSPPQMSAALLSVPQADRMPNGDGPIRAPKADGVDIPPVESLPQTSAVLLPVQETVAYPLQADPVAQSRVALLGDSDTEKLREEIQNSTVPDHFRRLTILRRVSDDLNFPLLAALTIFTKDCLALLLARFIVSEDLHKPLSRSAKSDGKRYSAEAQMPAATIGPERLQTPPLAFVGGALGNRKSSEQSRDRGNKRVKREMSVWDLLLPLLQPPLNLDFGDEVDLPSSLKLHVFQNKGVEFLVETQAALLGDDMGTGKTVQAAVALRILFQTAKIRTALIVCPLSVIPNWSRELAKWADNLAVTVVRGNKEHRATCWRQPTHVWLTTYDTLRNDLEHVLTLRKKGGFDLIALDEAQRIKNWNAGVTRAIRQLHATHRWGLTGTPLENNTDELWAILNVLKPGISKGPLDWSEGIQSVLRPMFLRRRKQDVLMDLPPLVQNPVWVRLEYEQRKSYDELEKQGVLELHAKGETITAQTILVLLNKLKQVCNRCPRTGESAKLVWLRDSLEGIAAEGDKTLVFSQYTDERFAGADWLEKELVDFGALNYSKATTDKKRKDLLAAFHDKLEHRVFVGHPKVAGLGLNELVVANYVVHFDHWWNPAVMNQATARAHRPGQTKTVFAYDLWIEDTYEEVIFKLLERKQGLYNEVIESLSAERDLNSIFSDVAYTLFEKYKLKPIPRKPIQGESEIDTKPRR